MIKSFTHEIKKEICRNGQTHPRHRKAQAYGLFLFGKTFGPDSISLHTEHKAVARYYADSIFFLARLRHSITLREVVRQGRPEMYVVTVDDAQDRLAILSYFGYAHNSDVFSIRWDLLSEEDLPVFLSGVFLACGTIGDPEKGYRGEFSTPYRALKEELSRLLCQCLYEPKETTRRNRYVLYYKESGQIEDLLTYMGASASTLSLMQVKILKDVRNSVNRQTNCVTANISRTVNASMEQIRAIEQLKAAGILQSLDEQLQELALLRCEHPEYSLRELGESLTQPLSRSAVNHRMQRILAAVESETKKTEEN